MNEPTSATVIRAIADSSPPSNIEHLCVACEGRLTRTAILRTSPSCLFRCDSCGTWTSLPRPTAQSQTSLHDTSEYFDHPYFRARREEKNLSLKRCRTIFSQIGRITDVGSLRGERMLDVGCDVGSLLLAAAECYGVVPAGLDVASRAVQVARSRGLHVFHETLEHAPPDLCGFRVVAAVDVLEHTADPGAFLRGMRERMLPGGVLYVQTPNCDSVIYGVGRLISRLTGGRPRSAIGRLFPAEHIQYFSRRGLGILAERCGFDVADMETRALPAHEIATSTTVRSALMGLQAIDRFRSTQILLCAVLRRR